LIKDLEVLYSPLRRKIFNNIIPWEEASLQKNFFDKLPTKPQPSHRKFFRPPPTVEDVLDEEFQKQSKSENSPKLRPQNSLNGDNTTSSTSNVIRDNDKKTHNSPKQDIKGFGSKSREDTPQLGDLDDINVSNLSQSLEDIHIVSPQKPSVVSTSNEPSKARDPEVDSKLLLKNKESKDQSDAIKQPETVPSINSSPTASTYNQICHTLFDWRFPPRITSLNNLLKLVRGPKVGE